MLDGFKFIISQEQLVDVLFREADSRILSKETLEMDGFDRLHTELHSLKEQQTSDHRAVLTGLADQRDRTREAGGMLRLVADQLRQVAEKVGEVAGKVDEVAEKQLQTEGRLRNIEDRWGKIFGSLEQMTLELRREVATKEDLAEVTRRVEALEQRPPAA